MAYGELEELFDKFLRNDISESGLRLFQNMVSDPANRTRVDALLKDHYETGRVFSQSDNLDELFESFFQKASRRNTSRSSGRIFSFSATRWKVSAAASVGLLIAALGVLFYFLHDRQPGTNPMVISAQNGERKNVTLPDGSRVRINAGSTLTLAEGFNTRSRTITLTGEAYFDVARNKNIPFVIHTASMDVKVLGTSFNIRAYPAEPDEVAALIDGKILVSLTDSNGRSARRDYYLSALQKIVVPKGRAEPIGGGRANTRKGAAGKSHVDSLRISTLIDKIPETAWTENVLFFNADPFSEVKEKLETWYGVKVRIDNKAIENLHFTGSYQDMTIREVMEALHMANPGLNFKIENDEKLILIY